MDTIKPIFWSSVYGKVVHYLRSKPFVNIISEPRTGSTALYESLRRDQTVDLDEIMNKNNFNDTMQWINKNTDECRVMKNHSYEVSELSKPQQEIFFNIKAFHVGLLRRNFFEQTCSVARAELTNNYHAPTNKKVYIDPDFYTNLFWRMYSGKTDMFTLWDQLDMILYYEDIDFSKSQKRRKWPDKKDTIENFNELKKIYAHLIKRVSVFHDLAFLDK